MFHGNRKSIVLIAVCCSAYFQATARAIDAVFIPGPFPAASNTDGAIEVQGFNGRLDLPINVQGPNQPALNIDRVTGATATDSILYTLFNPISSGSSIITEANTHTGAYLGEITLPSKFTDIAYTNGQLYGVQSVQGANQTQSMQIAAIAANGSIQPVFTQSTIVNIGPNWRLSGAFAGDSLLISPPSVGNPLSAETFVPSTPATPPSTFTLPFGTNVTDTVIHADTAGVTVISNNGGSQVDYSYPGATLIGARSQTTLYGNGTLHGVLSDEFNYNYPSSQPAYAIVDISSISNSIFQGANDGLYRQPQTLSGMAAVSIENGVTPDGTTINNVVANELFQQTAGPIDPFTIQETDSPAGPFTNRQIAQANITINLANATKGVYAVGTNTNVTADYTTGTTVQPGQPVSVSQNTVGEFAYDPASANLVGNGDGSLSGFGWELADRNTGVVDHGFADNTNLGLGLVAESGDLETLSQILQLPTSNGPMQLSFSSEQLLTDSADLTILLNGVVVGDVSVTSQTPATFQTLITDPSLENISNATLTFQVTDTANVNGATWVGLGSISLTGVPEPASASLLGFVAAAIFTCGRRRRI